MAEALQQMQVERLSGIMVLLGTQNAQASIDKFSGDPRKFQSWIKSIDKYVMIVNGDADSKKTFALQTAEGAVSEFLIRYYTANADCTWDTVLTQLQTRFGDIVDSQHALQVLRTTKQKQGETIQVFAERLIDMAEQAWPGRQLNDVLIERQMIDCLIDGLTDNAVARKVMRDAPPTFNGAVQIAINEQNLSRKFELRNRSAPRFKPSFKNRPEQRVNSDRRDEPMDVDAFQGTCFKCGKRGHRAVNCKAKPTKTVHEVSRQAKCTCFKCGEGGHVLAACQNRGNPTTGRCWLCGQRGHRQAGCPNQIQAKAESWDEESQAQLKD